MNITGFYDTDIFYVSNSLYPSKILVSTEVSWALTIDLEQDSLQRPHLCSCGLECYRFDLNSHIDLYKPGQVFLTTECEWQKFLPYSIVVRIKYQCLSQCLAGSSEKMLLFLRSDLLACSDSKCSLSKLVFLKLSWPHHEGKKCTVWLLMQVHTHTRTYTRSHFKMINMHMYVLWGNNILNQCFIFFSFL